MVQVHTPQTSEEIVKLTESASPDCVIALYFHAPWAEPCQQMGQIFLALAAVQEDSAKSLFITVDAEECPEYSEKYEVAAVPYTVLTNKAGKVIDKVEGVDAAALRDLLGKHLPASAAAAAATPAAGNLGATSIPPAQQTAQPVPQSVPEATANGEGVGVGAGTDADADADAEEEPLNERLQKLVNAAPVMLFMKGTPAVPQCGFSRKIVGLLRERNVRYGFFNILADDEVRQGLKKFSDWPTYPQLYLQGELVGGLDIVSIFLLLLLPLLSPPTFPMLTFIFPYFRSRKNWKMILISLRTFEQVVGWIGTYPLPNEGGGYGLLLQTSFHRRSCICCAELPT